MLPVINNIKQNIIISKNYVTVIRIASPAMIKHTYIAGYIMPGAQPGNGIA